MEFELPVPQTASSFGHNIDGSSVPNLDQDPLGINNGDLGFDSLATNDDFTFDPLATDDDHYADLLATDVNSTHDHSVSNLELGNTVLDLADPEHQAIISRVNDALADTFPLQYAAPSTQDPHVNIDHANSAQNAAGEELLREANAQHQDNELCHFELEKDSSLHGDGLLFNQEFRDQENLGLRHSDDVDMDMEMPSGLFGRDEVDAEEGDVAHVEEMEYKLQDSTDQHKRTASINGQMGEDHHHLDDVEGTEDEADGRSDYEDGSVAFAEESRSWQASPVPSAPDNQSLSEDQRWSFRPNPRDKGRTYTSWIDKDETGDYDPNAKRLRPLKKLRTNGVPRREPRDEAPRSANRSLHIHRLTGDRLCVTLNLCSDAGRELLRKGIDNWPDDIYINTLRDPEYAADESSDDFDSSGTSKKLRRTRLQALSHASEQEDFTGKPEGRGCRFCRSLGQPCSMRDDDGAYPCDTCLEEGEDCEPLITPKTKQACETCRREGRGCSYAYEDEDTDHSKPCAYCNEHGFKCIAGPVIDPSRCRMDASGNPVIPKACEPRYKKGRFKSCAACRRGDRICDLLKTRGEPPCSLCKRTGTPCTFEAVDRSPKKSSDNDIIIRKGTLSPIQSRNKAQSPITTAPQTVRDSSPGDSPPTSSPDHSPNILPPQPQELKGTVDFIKTRLSHPITFNAAPDPAKPCNWCSGSDPYYPLFGHRGSERTVKVLIWENKQGCNETSGGHHEQGKPQSQMCFPCTFQRVQIMFCTDHQFRPAEWIRKPENKALAVEALSRGSPGFKPMRALGRLERLWKAGQAEVDKVKAGTLMRNELALWCAICPSLAAYECCSGDKMECQLRLCKICHRLVAGPNNRDLTKFVRDVRNLYEENPLVRKMYPLKLRADYDFFQWKSFMMRQTKAAHKDIEKEKEKSRREKEAGRKKAKAERENKRKAKKGNGKGKVVELNANGKRPRA